MKDQEIVKKEIERNVRMAERHVPNPQVDEMLAYLNHSHKCERCGYCCTDMAVGMTGPELVEIAKFLNMRASDFKKKYVAFQVKKWIVLDQVEGRCPFLRKGADDKHGCSIYSVRPMVCRVYPFMSPIVVMNSQPFNIIIPNDMCPHMKETVERVNGEIRVGATTKRREPPGTGRVERR